MKRNNILIAGGLILIAAIARIVNYEVEVYNLAPVAALGLFAGSVLNNKRVAYLFTILAMLISDVYIEFFTSMSGFYDISQFFVYGSLILVTLMGTTLKKHNPLKIAGYSITGSAIFFILSNFGTYLTGYWGYGIEGLITTYTAAIPFAKNTFISDLLFSGLLFGAYTLLQHTLTNKAVKVKA